MTDPTTLTSTKPEGRNKVTAQPKKPDPMLQWILETERIGFETDYQGRQTPPSFEAQEVINTPVLDYIERPLAGSISFTAAAAGINVSEGVQEIIQGAAKVTESAVSALGGATQETWGAGVDLFKMVVGGPVEINSAQPVQKDQKQREKAANLANTRAFLEDLTARQQKIRMEERMQMALRIIEAPDITEQDKVMLGVNANQNTESLTNISTMISISQKRSALQVAQQRQVQQQEIAQSKSGPKMAVHADAALEGGKGKGSQNMSVMNAGG